MADLSKTDAENGAETRAVSLAQRIRSSARLEHPGYPAHPIWLVVAIGFVIAITLAHYVTNLGDIGMHNVYRRLSYIPIVLAAFSHGFRGGFATAVVACLAYMPHAFFIHHRDPAPTVDKLFEMALYLVIGGMTGWLIDRRQQTRRALELSLAERDELETQLVRAGKMSALGQMAAGLAHEIRNPLASIMGSAEALAAEFDEGHRKHRLGQLLLKEIDRLNRVVTDCLGFARPVPPQRTRQNPAELARNVIALTEREASTREVDVQFPGPEPEAIDLDPDQITQVMLNLVLNAYQAFDQLDATKVGARQVRVRFREREVAAEKYLGIGIEDNGRGIPASLGEQVFDPYFSTRADGTGLGLSVSNRIVEAHDGFMEVERGENVTCVWFFLPKEGR